MKRISGGLQPIHIILIIIAGVIIAGLAGALIFYQLSGEVVYKGTIVNREVIYTENKIEPIDIVQNIMIVQEGTKTYKMYDKYDETSIDWKNETMPVFENDKLEKVIIIENSEEKKYYSSEANEDDLEGIYIKGIFDETNSLYNQIRNAIRINLREDYIREHQIRHLY